MNILEKFNVIEIKNDTRISESDFKFCEVQQRLYQSILSNYTRVYNKLLETENLQNDLEKSLSEENTYYKYGNKHEYYSHTFVSIGNREFAEIAYSVHKKFISIIVNYFTEKYGVSLEQNEYRIIKVKPPEIKNFANYYYVYRGLTEKEIKKIKRENEEFDKKEEQYFEDIIKYRIDFNEILDDIFMQLDGYSFTDKVKKEIIDACVKSCEGYRNKSAELKNNKIVFTNATYSHYDGIFERYEISLNGKNYLNILRGLCFFDSDGKAREIYDAWEQSYVRYSMTDNDGIYNTFNVFGNKINTFKFYKNGKFEVKFKTSDFAKDFAKTYCGLEI